MFFMFNANLQLLAIGFIPNNSVFPRKGKLNSIRFDCLYSVQPCTTNTFPEYGINLQQPSILLSDQLTNQIEYHHEVKNPCACEGTLLLGGARRSGGVEERRCV